MPQEVRRTTNSFHAPPTCAERRADAVAQRWWSPLGEPSPPPPRGRSAWVCTRQVWAAGRLTSSAPSNAPIGLRLGVAAAEAQEETVVVAAVLQVSPRRGYLAVPPEAAPAPLPPPPAAPARTCCHRCCKRTSSCLEGGSGCTRVTGEGEGWTGALAEAVIAAAASAPASPSFEELTTRGCGRRFAARTRSKARYSPMEPFKLAARSSSAARTSARISNSWRLPAFCARRASERQRRRSVSRAAWLCRNSQRQARRTSLNSFGDSAPKQ